jgi:hypothetical protein
MRTNASDAREKKMTKKQIKAIVEAATFEKDGRIRLTCAEAFKIAKKHGISMKRIGQVCDKSGIRLCRCQLGCFK